MHDCQPAFPDSSGPDIGGSCSPVLQSFVFAAPHERLLPQKLRQQHANAAFLFVASLALVRMPLSLPISRRVLKHRRAIQIEAFARDDGLWISTPTFRCQDTRCETGFRHRLAGVPLHDMLLRITIDTRFNIVAAEAASEMVPYPGYCDTIALPIQN